MSSVIIHGTNADGRRVGASVPDFLWKLFVAKKQGDEKIARDLVRYWIAQRRDRYSWAVQYCITTSIAQPSLLTALDKQKREIRC